MDKTNKIIETFGEPVSLRDYLIECQEVGLKVNEFDDIKNWFNGRITNEIRLVQLHKLYRRKCFGYNYNYRLAYVYPKDPKIKAKSHKLIKRLVAIDTPICERVSSILEEIKHLEHYTGYNALPFIVEYYSTCDNLEYCYQKYAHDCKLDSTRHSTERAIRYLSGVLIDDYEGQEFLRKIYGNQLPERSLKNRELINLLLLAVE